MQKVDTHKAREKVWDLIEDISVALLTTHHANGRMHARPMVAMDIEREQGVLWFFTSKTSEKVSDIARDPNVLLCYSEPDDQHYVSISGEARLVEDKTLIRDKWSEHLRTWFPKGIDDPEISLLRVEAHEAEYWDAPNSVFVYVYGYLKARLTGERPYPGEVASVTL